MTQQFHRHARRTACLRLWLWLISLMMTSSAVCDAEIPVIAQHEDNVYGLAFSPDGRRLASASGDHTAVLRDALDGANAITLQHSSPVYAIEYSPDGKLIATADGSGNVRLWRINGKLVAEQRKHRDAVYAVTFSPDGSRLASAGGGGNGGDTRCLIWNVADLSLRQELTGHTRAVYGLMFQPSGEFLVSSSSDRTLRLWNLSGASPKVFEEHSSDAYRCHRSRDGQKLISGGQDKNVRIRELEQDKTYSLEPVSRDPVYEALFTPDGRLILAVGDDGHLRIWNTPPSPSHRGATKVSRQALYAIAVSPDSKLAAVAGADDRIYLIDLPTK